MKRSDSGSDRGSDGGSEGVVVLAATPIGHAGDAPPRLAEELAHADVIAAEDTRRLQRLLRELDVAPTGTILSYHEHNEASRTADLVTRLDHGERIVLVTDAGMPSVSDPGYRLVRAAVDAGHRVTAVPGPSAVLTAVAVSGLPVDRFCFEGFLPRKAGERRRVISALTGEQRTMVFFEAPHRLADSLTDLAEVLGPDRPAAVCRELTKTYEEVVRGSLGELAAWASEGTRGEITLVVEGAGARHTDPEEALDAIAERVAAGERLKTVCGEVAAETGLSRKALYDGHLARTRR